MREWAAALRTLVYPTTKPFCSMRPLCSHTKSARKEEIIGRLKMGNSFSAFCQLLVSWKQFYRSYCIPQSLHLQIDLNLVLEMQWQLKHVLPFFLDEIRCIKILIFFVQYVMVCFSTSTRMRLYTFFFFSPITHSLSPARRCTMSHSETVTEKVTQ